MFQFQFPIQYRINYKNEYNFVQIPHQTKTVTHINKIVLLIIRSQSIHLSPSVFVKQTKNNTHKHVLSIVPSMLCDVWSNCRNWHVNISLNAGTFAMQQPIVSKFS